MKKTFLFTFIFIIIAQISFSSSIHLIGGQFGISFPGGKEITDIYPAIATDTNIYSYNTGIEYNFKFFPYLSIGAGCNYLFKSYLIDFLTKQITYNYNAVEPYGIVRGYLQVMNGIDIFAGAGAGYSFLIGSTISDSLTATKTDVNGSGVSLKFCGGLAYEGSGFTTMLEGGYKIMTISPLKTNSGEIKNSDDSSAVANFGGPFINVLIFLSFGNNQEQKTNGEIKAEKQTSRNAQEQTGEVSEKTENINPVETQEQRQEAEGSVQPDKTGYATMQEDDTEGIIILSPGESEINELEKYIASKRRQIIPEEETKEGEEIEFEYDAEQAGVLLLEADAKSKVEKAGYVLVEKAGFITNNFTEDGFIFTKKKEKMFLYPADFAYIRLTVGKSANKGKEFIIYDDSEDVMDNISGQPMGKMINILGVAKIVEPVENNIFKVQITKAYAPIKEEMKIKERNNIRDYHRTLSKKIKNKNLNVEGYIVKVQKDVLNIKNKDIVYLNVGVSKGILPGEKLNIYRRTYNKDEDKEENFHKIGSLLIINSVQNSSVGLVTEQNELINIGDIVKTK
ncbi:MAG: hypothetical protein KA120_00710 [Candidatus Goldbacteria bacterium]|nr:hypothetical protein [Candidatus Goldiibacteriota bacterium]